MHRFLRYGTVGALATGAHYAVLLLAVQAAGWPAWCGSGAGALVGAQLAYLGNRHYTFGQRGGTGVSWPRFQLTALLGGLLGMGIVAVGVQLGLHYAAAQGVATATGLLLTFAINQRWTFA